MLLQMARKTCSFDLGQWFSMWWGGKEKNDFDFAPWGDLTVSIAMVGCHKWEAGHYWHLMGKAKDATKHFRINRAVSHNKEWSGLKWQYSGWGTLTWGMNNDAPLEAVGTERLPATSLSSNISPIRSCKFQIF